MIYEERLLDYKHPGIADSSGPNNPPENSSMQSAPAITVGLHELAAMSPTSMQHTSTENAASYVISETIVEDL